MFGVSGVWQDHIDRLEIENEKLRIVAKAAKEWVETYSIHDDLWVTRKLALKKALAELEKEGGR
jgi:hypothetical protein